MKFMIKPKYQYILIFLHYGLIALIAILNYIQVKKYKQAAVVLILISIITIVGKLIFMEVIGEKSNIVIAGISIETIYIELLNIGVGYLLIRNQKKNIQFY